MPCRPGGTEDTAGIYDVRENERKGVDLIEENILMSWGAPGGGGDGDPRYRGSRATLVIEPSREHERFGLA